MRMQTLTEQMNNSTQFCPNEECKARGKVGQGTMVIHSRNVHDMAARRAEKRSARKRERCLLGRAHRLNGLSSWSLSFRMKEC